MRHLILTTATVFSLFAGAFAHATFPGPFSHEVTDLPPDPNAVWGQLDNGMKYAILPHDEPPGRISLRLLVDAGSLNESEAQRGLAHFLEHMAFNGTTHFAPDEMVEYFQRIGMAFGADTNAHTGFDETVYKIELPENSATYLKEGLKVLRDYADGMLLLDEEIEKERGVILAEKRSRDSVGFRTFEAYWDFIFPQSIISKRLPIGLEDVISTAPRAEFLDFYDTWYTPSRMALVVVGDIASETAKTEIIEAFQSMSPAEEPPADPDLGELWQPELAVRLHSEPEAETTEVSIISLRPFESEDSRAERIARMQEAVANQIVARRIEKRSKAADAPFSAGSASSGDYLHFFEYANIDVTCRPEKWDASLAVAEQVLRQALDFGFNAAEVNEATANLLNAYEEAAQRASTRKSRSLSSQIVDSLSSNEVFTSPAFDLELAREALVDLSAEDVHAAFKRVWSAENRFLFVSGNLELENPDEAIRAVYLASTEAPVEPIEAAEVGTFAYMDFGPAGEIAEETLVDDLGIHQLRFANNVRLNIKQTDYEANTVHVAVRFGSGDLVAPVEQPGLSRLAAATFIQGGLVAHSKDEIDTLMAGKTVGASFMVEEDAFLLSGSTNPDDLDKQLSLLAAYLTAPGYREEAIRLARDSFEEMYVQIEHTMEGALRNEVARFLASGDPRFGFPAKEDLMQRTLPEVAAWLELPLRESYLEISVVGDIEPDMVKSAVARTFGALPERAAEKPALAEARVVAFPEGVEAKTFSYPSEISRAAALVYWPTDDIWDIAQTRRLGLLSEIFSDRLRVKVREAIGEAYSPYAVHRPSETFDDYGLFYSVVVTSPEVLTEINEAVVEISRSIVEEGVTEDEFDRALKPMLNSLNEWVRNNRYWLSRVLLRSQEKPAVLDWARSMRDDYANITVEELNAVAQQYLKPTAALRVQVVPETGSTSAAMVDED